MKGRWDKLGAQVIIDTGFLSAVEHVEARQRNVLRILDYHRIGTPNEDVHLWDPSLVSATPKGFAAQMEYLRRAYNPISVEQLLEALDGRRRLPPRAVMVTFDDGYYDFLEYAWPVLRSYKIPAMLFAVTDYLSDPYRLFWWDRVYQALQRTTCTDVELPGMGCWQLRTVGERSLAFDEIKRKIMRVDHDTAMQLVNQIVQRLGVTLCERRMMLNWDEMRQMCDEGLYVGAHTVSHPILSRMTPEGAREEIITSHAIIGRELGQAWPVFAYPVGHPADLRPDLVTTLQAEGFRAAMTMIEGHNVIGRTHPLRLKRVGMAPHLSLNEFRLVLTRAYDLYGLVTKLGHRVG